MPGYVLHLAEAEIIMNVLAQHRADMEDLAPDGRNRFRLGALLPDVLRGSAKERTHFWNPADKPLLAKAPDLSRFLTRYGTFMNTPEMLGYYVHLHLDARYVHEFWPRTFQLTDDEGRPCTRMDEVTQIHLLHRSRASVPASAFFSSAWYYGDYSRLNAYLLDRYHVTIPVYRDLTGFPVEEADPSLLCTVLSEIAELCRTCRPGEEKNLRVFTIDGLEEFLSETAQEAARELLPVLQTANHDAAK